MPKPQQDIEKKPDRSATPQSTLDKKPLRFVVQEHHARRLHWDFRLELDRVLKSWAVPRGVPVEPGIKRLAVQVEDHPLNYYGWEGQIPEGQYGAGTVKVWDKGQYILEVREPRKYHIFLRGTKLKGDYRLINFKDKNWLIYKTTQQGSSKGSSRGGKSSRQLTSPADPIHP